MNVWLSLSLQPRNWHSSKNVHISTCLRWYIQSNWKITEFVKSIHMDGRPKSAGKHENMRDDGHSIRCWSSVSNLSMQSHQHRLTLSGYTHHPSVKTSLLHISPDTKQNNPLCKYVSLCVGAMANSIRWAAVFKLKCNWGTITLQGKYGYGRQSDSRFPLFRTLCDVRVSELYIYIYII